MRKRAFDVGIVCLAAIVWLPVVALSGLAVLLFSGRPILYRSRRWVGPTTVIDMVKLRVMIPNAHLVPPSTGQNFLSTPRDSPLYTRVGRILDQLGLNEIPQFIHVLRGEMSIVGARPLTDAVRDHLLDHDAAIDGRWETPAGLTGLPQLVGRSELTDSQRLRLEEAYARAASVNYRVSMDFMILLHTVLITFGLRKHMSYEQALLSVDRPRLRSPRATRIAPQRLTVAGDSDIDAVA